MKTDHPQSAGGRIARNAGWLYLRLGIKTVADLLVVRIVLQSFGVSGFGVCSAVIGTLELVFFSRWTLEVTVRRFICHKLGVGEEADVSRTLTAGCVLAGGLSLAFVALAELVGLPFFISHVSIQAEYRTSALWLFHFGVAALTFATLRMPLAALVISVERMDFFAKISVLETVLSILVAVAVGGTGIRRLEVYGSLLFANEAIISFVYVYYCRRRFPLLTHFCHVRAKDLWLQSGFFFKSLLTDIANLLKRHGVNLLLGVYAGTAYNASWGVSKKIGDALYGLIAGFQEATFPQIVKLWTMSDKSPFVGLLAGTVRWSAILVGTCVVPLILFTTPVLVMWIGGDIPPDAAPFVRCVAVELFFTALSVPLKTAVFATGRIARYQVEVSILMAMGFAGAWLCLANDCPAWTAVGSVAASNFIVFLYRLWYVRRHLSVDVCELFRRAFLRGAHKWYNSRQ